MMLPNKAIGALVVAAGILFAFGSTYSAGVKSGREEKQKIIDQMVAEGKVATNLANNQTEKVKKEIVYRDRVIVQKNTELEKKVDDVLKEESRDCRIGDGFIWLHNAAGSSAN